jgi:Fe(3+) dicitrate transport protein
MIKEVTIIGTKEEKQSLPGSGMQIGAAELRRHGYTDLNQIVSSVPGVYVREEDGYGLRPNIGIRGATSERSQKNNADGRRRVNCPSTILSACCLLHY